MKKILVIGLGYIGFEAAVALRRAGHSVFGVIRTNKPEMRQNLEAAEIEVIEADAHDIKTYIKRLEEFDTIIDCLAPWPAEDGKGAKSAGILDAVCEIAKRTKKMRRYIFTGGVMSYGDHQGRMVDETTPPNPNGCLMWKANYEESVRNRSNPAEFIETVDVRPGWVYGGDFGRYVDWFSIPENSNIKYIGAIDKKFPWIHIYDLGNAYVAIVEATGDKVTGQLFNITDDTNVPNADIQEAFARTVWGDKIGKTVPADNVATDGKIQSGDPLLEYSLLASSAKLQRVTGWKPKLGPILSNVPLLYKAWKAAQGN